MEEDTLPALTRDHYQILKKLTESFGHTGFKVTNLDQLNEVFTLIFSEKYKNLLVFVDVEVDPEEHVYPMAIKGGAINDMLLSRNQRT